MPTFTCCCLKWTAIKGRGPLMRSLSLPPPLSPWHSSLDIELETFWSPTLAFTLSYCLWAVSDPNGCLPRRWHFVGFLCIFQLLNSFCPLFPEPQRAYKSVLLRTEFSAVTLASHLGQPQDSSFKAIQCKENLLWLRLRVAFVYQYKHNYLGSSLKLNKFG